MKIGSKKRKKEKQITLQMPGAAYHIGKCCKTDWYF